MNREVHVRICGGRRGRFPPSTRLVNMNAGSEVVMVGDVLVDCGAAWEMEVWPSRVVLRKKALNRREGHWLKTVVLSVVGKGAT